MFPKKDIIKFFKSMVADSNLAGQKQVVIFDPAATDDDYFSIVPLSGFGKTKLKTIKQTDFTGNDCVVAELVNKTANEDFIVFAFEGDGGLLSCGTASTDGYAFDKPTGKITATAGNYLIIIF